MLELLGQDTERDGLLKTPRAWPAASSFLTRATTRTRATSSATPCSGEYDEMVVVRDIELYSLCEHHLLPFFGKAATSPTCPNGKVVGLSKLPRLVDVFARRLQVQERLTTRSPTRSTRSSSLAASASSSKPATSA